MVWLLNEDAFEVIVGTSEAKLIRVEEKEGNTHFFLSGAELLMDDDHHLYPATTYDAYLNDKYEQVNFPYTHREVGADVELVFTNVSSNGTYQFVLGLDGTERRIQSDSNAVVVQLSLPKEKAASASNTKKTVRNLSAKEKEALRIALSVLNLNDSSDYVNGLWDIVALLTGDTWEEDGLDLHELEKLAEAEPSND